MKMKKLLALLVSALCLLSACGSPDTSSSTSSSTSTPAQSATQSETQTETTGQKVSVVKKYKATNSISEGESYEKVMYARRDDNYYYYTLYLGYIENVPLNENVPFHKYEGNAYTKTFKESSTTVSTITQQSASLTKRCISNSQTDSSNNTVTGLVKIGTDTFPVGGEISHSFEWGSESTETNSLTNMSANSYVQAEEVSKTYTDETSFSFDSSCKIGYYRYIMIGTFDVYAIVLAELDELDNVVNYYVDYKTVLAGYGFTLDYSENSKFTDHEYEQLTLNLNAIVNLPPPTEYITENEGDIGGIPGDDTKKMVYFDKNQGVGGTNYVSISNDGQTDGTVLQAPIRDGYIFTGYYSEATVGAGERYFDHNMKLIKALTSNHTDLVAHWVPATKVVTLIEAGNNVVLSEKNPDGIVWKDNTATGVFTTPYSYSEMAELKAVGCAYLNLKINVGIRIEEECYEHFALRKMYNGTFVGDFHLYRTNVDGYGIMCTWVEAELYYGVDISYFDTPANGLQLICGISGSRKNEWSRGSVVVTYTPSGTRVTTSNTYA